MTVFIELMIQVSNDVDDGDTYSGPGSALSALYVLIHLTLTFLRLVLIGPHFTGEKLEASAQGHMASCWQNWLGVRCLPPLLAGVIGTLLPIKPLGVSLDQRCGLVTLLSSLSRHLADLNGRPWRLCRSQPVTFNWVHHWPSWSEPYSSGPRP